MKPKRNWAGALYLAVFALLGGLDGFLLLRRLGQSREPDRPIGYRICVFLLWFAWVYGAMLVQIILHEAGHLVCGLLSGYRFSSFRIFSLMLVRERGRIRLKRFSVVGTGGQCLLSPPELRDGKIPVILYNLGGVLANVLFAALSGAGALLSERASLLQTALWMLSASGLVFALTNGIPMHAGPIDNDGMNAFSLRRDPKAMRAFWVQMKINSTTADGVRLRDMPAEWFVMPDVEGMRRSALTAALGVFSCERLMDEHRFAEADAQMERLLSSGCALLGLHRQILVCDRIFCALLAGSFDAARVMMTPAQKKFMKSMRCYPSVLRTRYAWALLAENDPAEAAKIRSEFEKCAERYPYSADIASERELLAAAG